MSPATDAVAAVDAVISTRALCKVYSPGTEAEVVALRDVELRSGAANSSRPSARQSGKSTLMNLIGCLDTPSSGTTVRWRRRREPRCRGVRCCAATRSASCSRTQPAAAPTAPENVAMPMGYANVPREGAWPARGGAGAVGLGERAGHRPGELPGGKAAWQSPAR
jgi:ABC-type lipoprotein export system ATPase subunit